jgi:hypothetical protein
MCEKVQQSCAPYIPLLTPEQQAFINCNQEDSDGSPKFSTESDCYVLDNLVGCGNNSNNTGISLRFFFHVRDFW